MIISGLLVSLQCEFLVQDAYRPVIMITRIPAALHSSMELITSLRGGSSMPTQPTNVKSVCKKKESLRLDDLCSMHEEKFQFHQYITTNGILYRYISCSASQ